MVRDDLKLPDDGDEEEENEHVKIFEEDVNNSPYENKEIEGGDEIDYVSIDLIFIIF